MQKRAKYKQRKKTDVVCLFGGGAFGLKSESRRRGMKFVISLHVPDNWKRQLAVGGEKGIRTLVGLRPNGFQDRLVMTASISLRV